MSKKRVTSSEVAKEAGVSRTTVSFVLNNAPNTGIPEETRRKVLETAARLQYHPNATGRRLASGRTKTIAYVMHQSPERAAADLFLPQVLFGLVTVARRHHYHVLFHPVDPENREDNYTSLIYEGYVDGLILANPQHQEPQAVSLRQQGYPVVVTGRLSEDLPCVDADNFQGAQLATNHLLALGHRRIGLITNASRHYISSQERYNGYRHSLMAAGLPSDDSLVQEGDFTGDSGYQAMNVLLQLEELPTAVYIASDVVALGAIQAIKLQGLSIPQDIAIVGFDDVSPSQYTEPSLTTVRLPAYDLGWHTGHLLLQLINQQRPQNLTHMLTTELIVRASCGAIMSA